MRPAILLMMFLAVVATPAFVAAEDAAAYRVIVNPKNPLDAAEKRFIANALLKKTQHWPDGSLIHPVDLAIDAPTREELSRNLLGRSTSAVKSYWEQIIFSGRGVPPPELDSDERVIAYVLQHEGALGYVSNRANVGAVKVVSIR
jgi:hypothetical protein